MKTESIDLVPGSQEWHLCIANEIRQEAKEPTCEDKKHKEMMADFHELIGN